VSSREQSFRPVWLWAGASVLLVITLYDAWEARRVSIQLRNAHDQAAAEFHRRLALQERVATLQREKAILTDPASVKILLRPAQLQGVKLEATWNGKLGIVLSGQNVAAPVNSRVLQLWLIPQDPGGKPLPSLTIRPDAAGRVFLLVADPPENMEKTKALAVTEEPPLGSLQPTTSPLWAGRIN